MAVISTVTLAYTDRLLAGQQYTTSCKIYHLALVGFCSVFYVVSNLYVMFVRASELSLSAQVVNSHLVCDPTIRQLGFDLPQQQWSLLNRFHMEQGHCGACRRKWRLTDTDLCFCGETQTMSHTVESCPLTKLNGGLSWLHSVDEDAVLWLTSYGSWHTYEKKKKNFADQLCKQSRMSCYCLWSTTSSQLVSPPVKLSTYGGRVVCVSGPAFWNSLPEYLGDPSLSLDSFLGITRTHLFAS